MVVQPCFSNEDLNGILTGKVLCYSADLTKVLSAAKEMHEFQDSNLILKSWMDRANALASKITESETLGLEDVLSEIWQPSLREFYQLGIRIGNGFVTFEELDKAVKGCEDEGDGVRLRKEMKLMASKLDKYTDLEENWLEQRLKQIQEYRQLHHAAESSNAILKIRDKLNLKGDFSHIHSLTQLVK